MDAIIGVIGTILGTILGWVLNSISNRGKIKIFATSWEDQFQYNNIGSMTPSNSKEQTEYYHYNLILDLYNSSGDVKIMRNIVVAFYDDKAIIHQSIPKDDDTRKSSGPVSFYDNVTPLNIPPKTIIQLKLHDGSWNMDNDGLDYIWSTKKFILFIKTKRVNQRKFLLKPKIITIIFPHKRSK